MTDLTRELDRVKSKIFLAKDYSAFLASLMCSHEFIWDDKTPTASTNGLNIRWNPTWFMELPQATRVTVLAHELWHTARMHLLRIGHRDPKVWNYACDIRINNDLKSMAYTFEGTEPWLMPELDKDGILSEEQIYDLLMADPQKQPSGGSWGVGGGDLNDDGKTPVQSVPAEMASKIINAVIQATQQAEMSKNAGKLPGDIREHLDKFLNPVVPWERVLHEQFTALTVEDYSWKRPNKRFQNMYMPSMQPDEEGLEHLAYYLDVSGSISREDAIRFNSELKYIMDTIRPEKMTVVQFGTQITQVDVFDQGMEFNGLEIVGRGGTCFRCVREHILEIEPTAAVIFSDMYCEPMEKLPRPIPIIWAIQGNPSAQVPFGKVVHIPTGIGR